MAINVTQTAGAITVGNVSSSQAVGVVPNNPYPSIATDFPILQAEVEDARGTFDSVDLRLTSHDSSLSTLDTRASGLETRTSNLETASSSYESRLNIAEPKITTLQSEMATEKSKITSLQSDMTAEKAKIISLQSDMTAEKAKIVTLQSDNTTNKANIATLQSGKADKLMATNVLRNTNYADEMYLALQHVARSIANNECTLTVNNMMASAGQAQHVVGGSISTGDILYAKLDIFPFRTHNPTMYNGQTNTSTNVATANTWNTVSWRTPPCTVTDLVVFYVNGSSITDMQIGSVAKYRKPLIINLTKVFGAGNEPTLAEMDLLMSQFSNAWFDGTQELLSLKAIQKELSSKADKVQEAWITPTLLNGATGTVQYRRNTTGRIEFRGNIIIPNAGAGNAFQTLVTHRPLDTSRIAISQTDGVVNTVAFFTTGTFFLNASNKTCDLNGVSVI